MHDYITDARHANLKFFNYLVLVVSLVGLYFTTKVNYLLFHSLAEFFSIVVAFSLFMIAWHSRPYIRNPYLLFIGIAYLFVGLIDLLHTLSYKGMPVFPGYDYYANQLWIGARYMESISLLIAFIFLHTKRQPHAVILLIVYTLLTGIIVASIFYWKIFPECFIEGKGQTPFKIYSEYFICLILVANVYVLNLNREKFYPTVFKLLIWSLVCTIISELAFTYYISNYGFSNLVGHYFKIFSFFLVYLAIIKTGIEKPYDLIFRELDKANWQLRQEIDIRTKTEAEKEKLIGELQVALDQIRTLEGILPICMHCKKIRDDSGYWNEIEKYIHEHTDAKFSHGICHECMKKYYPEVSISKNNKVRG